jgi:predicted dehydrogenase
MVISVRSRLSRGSYSQDWLLFATDWNRRVDSGSSRTFADIGTHWCDLAEHVTGLKITSLCADLQTFIKKHKRPRGSVETFKGKNSAPPTDYDEVLINTEDFGSMIFKMGNVVRGSMTTSQVSAGRKNRLFLEIYGTKASAVWDGERPEELWIGHRSRSSELLIKDPQSFQKQHRVIPIFQGAIAKDTTRPSSRHFDVFIARRPTKKLRSNIRLLRMAFVS